MTISMLRNVTKKESAHENRAVLDGKIIYIVFGSDNYYDQISDLIGQ